MQIDIIWLHDNFDSFNARYFGGTLPTPRFYIGRSRTRLGSLFYQRGLVWGRTFPAAHKSKNAFTLTMSNYYDQTEFQFRNVLLHEMIHLSIAASGLRDTSSHGTIFRGMMARLNREGWNITVTTRMEGTKKAYTGSKTVIEQYLILALETRDGKRYLTSVNPRFAGALNARAKSLPEIKSHAWYTTSDRRYEDWPRVRSLRGRVVDEATYNARIAAMKPLDV